MENANQRHVLAFLTKEPAAPPPLFKSVCYVYGRLGMSAVVESSCDWMSSDIRLFVHKWSLSPATMMLETVNVNRLATHKPHLKACLIRYVIISFDRPRWRGNCTDPPQDKNFVMATIKMDKQLLGNRWSYKTLAYTSSSTAMGLCQSGIHEHNRAQLFSCLLPHRYRVEMSVANETG
ncbi:hypothetical protein Rs2_44797 [Raphanus sativus]|nr:hypothetical protein Rs2_44797 [Raphanus sativus]